MDKCQEMHAVTALLTHTSTPPSDLCQGILPPPLALNPACASSYHLTLHTPTTIHISADIPCPLLHHH